MINVFVENFTPSDQTRAVEINVCIDLNLTEKHFNYHLLNSDHRMTYQDIIDHINAITSIEDINIIANIDILFDKSILLLEKIENNQFVALTRYNCVYEGSPIFDEAAAKYTQDVWAWRGKCRITNANFYLGVWGCDNRFAYEANQAGYEVINPSYSVFVYHYHLSGIRSDNYGKETVPGPQYFVYPMTWKWV